MATEAPQTLRTLLQSCVHQGGFALGLSPGFFRFFAEMGACRVLEDAQLLDAVTHVSGASAGALVGGFLASGMAPSQLHDILMGFRREDFWDMGGIGGLLKGGLFQGQLEKHLPVPTFEQCKRQFGVTAFDVMKMRTTKVTSGELATAIRASCTFPLLFQPVWLEGSYHIDGGVFDDGGLMALPGVPASNTILNIVCDMSRLKSSVIPDHLSNKDSIRLVTLVLDNIPAVSPFTLDQGPSAFQAAYDAVQRALDQELIQGHRDNHWVVVADASVATDSPPLQPEIHGAESNEPDSPTKKLRAENSSVPSSATQNAARGNQEANGVIECKAEETEAKESSSPKETRKRRAA